jgi:hypothetical protein
LGVTYTISWDEFELSSVLQEHTPCCLLRVYPDACVSDHCRRRGWHAELLCCELDDSCERGFFWNSHISERLT